MAAPVSLQDMGELSLGAEYVDVAVPRPIDRLFTYRVPETLRDRVKIGSRVVVPFGRSRIVGYVLGFLPEAPDEVKVREIISLVDEEPLLTTSLIDLARRMTDRYVYPMGEVLRAILPPAIRISRRLRSDRTPKEATSGESHRPQLTEDQSAALSAVCEAIEKGLPERFLLHGLPGSGKTEVYIGAIEKALGLGKGAIVLVPEIALIPETVSRFSRRFGKNIAVLHSQVSASRRAGIWKAAKDGSVRVVLGTRSAVFTPVANLGIIVVDEEQDASFKQEEKPHFHAAKAALLRAECERAVLLLGSSAPSLEAFEESRSGAIRRLVLSSRPFGTRLPRIEIVDMRGKKELISEELLSALERCIERREKAIVLINRRGHASFVQCRACGWVDFCRNCSIPLTFHGRGQKLVCHYCGFCERVPDKCPRCGESKIVHRGVGTQRIEMEIANLLPGTRVERMDMDSIASRSDHATVLERLAQGKWDVLVGTQMALKGHLFPSVALIGVIAADRGLQFPDFRAAEKTFRLLLQAAGRIGEGVSEGFLIVQTRAPDHYIFEYLARCDYDGFAEAELALRKQLGYPPEGDIMLFTVSSRIRARAIAASEKVREALSKSLPCGSEILGPTPALVERLKGRFRYHLLLKGRLGTEARRIAVEIAREKVREHAAVGLSWDAEPAVFS